MPLSGPLSHLDISVGRPERSIPFYDALLVAIGFRRVLGFSEAFRGEAPSRAGWELMLPGGAIFGIEVRPARADARDETYDRTRPGPHHIAFHAESRAKVEAVHAAMVEMGAVVLDPPADYSARPGYGEGYYAAFFADPDGLKLEVVHWPGTNP